MYPYIPIFGCKVSTYYLMAMFGLAAAMLTGVMRGRSKRFRAKPEDVFYTVLSAFLGAVIGAKIFQLVGLFVQYGSSPDFWTATNWKNMLMGTGVFYGGLIGGTIAVLVYIHIRKLDFWKMSDVMTPSVLVFHIFGRIGCYCAGCCYGMEDTYGFAVFEIINSPDGIPLVPVQLFEAVFNGVVLLVLLIIRPERIHKGILFPLYIISYAVGRFILEFFRGDTDRGIYLLSVSQWISLVALVLGFVLLKRIRKMKRASV